jgi:hypothetical protein
MRLQPRRIEARTFWHPKRRTTGAPPEVAADDQQGQRRSRHFQPITLFPGGTLAGRTGTTILRVVYGCPEKRRRRTNLLVEPEGLNPLRLCPVSYSVKFGGWKDLRMRPVWESGVQRRIVARLAGFPVSRGGINPAMRHGVSSGDRCGAIANRASIAEFPTSACMLGRKIVPLCIEFRRRSTPGSPATAMLLKCPSGTWMGVARQDSRGLRTISPI